MSLLITNCKKNEPKPDCRKLYQNILILLVLVLSLFLFSSGCLSPSSLTGSVEGFVYEETNGGTTPLQGALVTISGSSNSALTDSDGYYRIDKVAIGINSLTVVKENYASKNINGIEVKENEVILIQDIITRLSDEEFLLNQGKNYYISEAYSQAIAAFQQLIEDFPDSEHLGYAQFYIGCSYYNLSLYEISIDEFNKLLENYPDSEFADDAQYYIGYCNEKKLGYYTKAFLEYYELINNYPGSMWADDAQLGMGNCYYANGEYDNAIIEYQKVITEYGDSPLHDLTQYSIAHCYRKLSDYNKAIIEYKKVISNYPGSDYSAPAQYYIGYTYYQEKETLKAIAEFQKVINNYSGAVWPGESEDRLIAPCAQYYIAWCYEKELGQYFNAINAYQLVIDNYPDSTWSDGREISPEAQFQIGECNRAFGIEEEDEIIQRGFLDAAIDAYQLVIDNYPDSTWSDGSLIAEDAQYWIDWINVTYPES